MLPPTSLVAQTVKNLPAMRETRVWSLRREDTLEKEMATHSGILAWKIPWPEEPGRLKSMGRKELYVTEQLTLSQIISPTQIFHQMPPSSSVRMTAGTESSTHPKPN